MTDETTGAQAPAASAAETMNAEEPAVRPVDGTDRKAAAARRKAVMQAREGARSQTKQEPEKASETNFETKSEGTGTGAEPAEGKQEQQAADNKVTEAAKAPEGNEGKKDAAAEFEKLISGEYKDAFGARVKGIITDRFKKNEEILSQTKGELDKYRQIAELVAGRYSIESDDADSLIKAITEDNALLEDAADEAGMSVEQYRQFLALKAKSKSDDARIAAINREKADRAAYLKIKAEEAELKRSMPEYSFLQESQNPIFRKLIQSGLTQKQAYDTVHAEEIRQKEIQSAVAEAEERFKAALNSSQAHPSVIGSSTPSQGTAKYSNMTPEQRKEAVRKARYGG